MDCSMPGFPVHHQLPKLAQTHVHWAGDAIQPSHPLLSPFPPAFNLPERGSFPMSQFNLIMWIPALSNSVKLWAMPCRATKMDRSWWWVLTKCGPLKKAMANHFSIIALRTPWIVWKEIAWAVKNDREQSGKIWILQWILQLWWRKQIKEKLKVETGRPIKALLL